MSSQGESSDSGPDSEEVAGAVAEISQSDPPEHCDEENCSHKSSIWNFEGKSGWNFGQHIYSFNPWYLRTVLMFDSQVCMLKSGNLHVNKVMRSPLIEFKPFSKRFPTEKNKNSHEAAVFPAGFKLEGLSHSTASAKKPGCGPTGSTTWLRGTVWLSESTPKQDTHYTM